VRSGVRFSVGSLNGLGGPLADWSNSGGPVRGIRQASTRLGAHWRERHGFRARDCTRRRLHTSSYGPLGPQRGAASHRRGERARPYCATSGGASCLPARAHRDACRLGPFRVRSCGSTRRDDTSDEPGSACATQCVERRTKPPSILDAVKLGAMDLALWLRVRARPYGTSAPRLRTRGRAARHRRRLIAGGRRANSGRATARGEDRRVALL
jgi:hypothetical protein